MTAVITGMGFCLPSLNSIALTEREDYWQTITTGRVHLRRENDYFGWLPNLGELFDDRFPDIPETHRANMGPVHHSSLLACEASLRDARLSIGGPEMSNTGIYTARAGSDSWFDLYDEVCAAIAARTETTAVSVRHLLMRFTVGGGANDAAFVIADYTGCGGPVLTLSAGCASGALAVGNALRDIQSGAVSRAIVVGVDFFNPDRMNLVQSMWKDTNSETLSEMQGVGIAKSKLMRPYDRRETGANMACGAASIVLESPRAARERGVEPVAKLIAFNHSRDPRASALSADINAVATVKAVTRALADAQIDTATVDYINGGSEGSKYFTWLENKMIETIFGDRPEPMPLTSQEACFGHNAAPLGILGVTATSLMLHEQVVCPTAACVEPEPGISFDPVPSLSPRPAALDTAVSLNYHVGAGTTALVLRSAGANA